MTSKKKRRIKKWPFFTFIPIGLFFSFFVYMFVMLRLDAVHIKEDQAALMEDFKKWSDDGFSVIYDDYTGTYQFPDGRFVYNENSLFTIAVSKDEFLFYNVSRGIEIYTTNWDFIKQRTLFSSKGDFGFRGLQGTKFLLRRYGDNVQNFQIDFLTGEVEEIYDESKLNYFYDSFGNIKEGEQDYQICLPNENIIEFPKENIDAELLALMNKWGFYPSKCRRAVDGSIYCMFKREYDLWSGGKSAALLFSIDDFGTIDGIQFTVNFSYDSYAMDIHQQSFAEYFNI